MWLSYILKNYQPICTRGINYEKKLLSKIIIGFTILSLTTIPVVASNYHDTAFDFYFKSIQGTSVTELREKQDDTSMYMKCNSTTYPYTAFAVGARSEVGARYAMDGGHEYTFYSGTVYKMINYVYENGYPYGGIKAQRSYSSSYNAKRIMES